MRARGATAHGYVRCITILDEVTMWLARLGAITALAALAAACVSTGPDPATAFSVHESCPADRVTVREEPPGIEDDLAPPLAPPAEIAADPERLAMWRASHPKSVNWAEGSTLHVEGCGVREHVVCRSSGFRRVCSTIERRTDEEDRERQRAVDIDMAARRADEAGAELRAKVCSRPETYDPHFCAH